MPTCVICGNPLICNKQGTHTPSGVVGGVSKPCPLKKGAIWVHVIDDEVKDVKGIAVKVESAPDKSTDPQGIAAFDPLDSKSYQVTIPAFSPEMAKKYEPPADSSETVSVGNGEITYVVFELKRLAELKVKLTQKGKTPEKAVGNIAIAVTGLPEKKSGESDGLADFGPLKAKDYTVSLKLTADEAKIYKQPDPVPVSLAPGEHKEQPIELTKIVWVKVLLQYKDDKTQVPEAKFRLMAGEKEAFSEPVKDGVVEAKDLDDETFEISFPEIDASEWEAVA